MYNIQPSFKDDNKSMFWYNKGPKIIYDEIMFSWYTTFGFLKFPTHDSFGIYSTFNKC